MEGTITQGLWRTYVSYEWQGKRYDVALKGDAGVQARAFLGRPNNRKWATRINGAWRDGELHQLSISVSDLAAPRSPELHASFATQGWNPGKPVGLISTDLVYSSQTSGPPQIAAEPPPQSKKLTVTLGNGPPIAVELLASDGRNVVVTPAHTAGTASPPLICVPVNALGLVTEQEWEASKLRSRGVEETATWKDFVESTRGQRYGVSDSNPMKTHEGAPDASNTMLRLEAELRLRQGQLSNEAGRVPVRMLMTGPNGRPVLVEVQIVRREGQLFIKPLGIGAGRSEWLPVPAAWEETLRPTSQRDASLVDEFGRARNSRLQSITLLFGPNGERSLRAEHSVTENDPRTGVARTITQWQRGGERNRPVPEPTEGFQAEPARRERWVLPLENGHSLPIVITQRLGDRVRFVRASEIDGRGESAAEYEIPLSRLRFIPSAEVFKKLVNAPPEMTSAALSALPQRSIFFPEYLSESRDSRWNWTRDGHGRSWDNRRPGSDLPVTVRVGGNLVAGTLVLDGERVAVVFTHQGKPQRLMLEGSLGDFLLPQVRSPQNDKWAVPVRGGRQNMTRRSLLLNVGGEEGSFRALGIDAQFTQRRLSNDGLLFNEESFTLRLTPNAKSEDYRLAPAIDLSANHHFVLSLARPGERDAYPLPVEVLARNGTHAVVARAHDVRRYSSQNWAEAYAQPMLVPLEALGIVPAETHALLDRADSQNQSPPGISRLAYPTGNSDGTPPELPLAHAIRGFPRPGDVKPEDARDHLALEAQLLLLQSEPRATGSEVLVTAIYRGADGQMHNAEANLVRNAAGELRLRFSTPEGPREVPASGANADQLRLLVRGQNRNSFGGHPVGNIEGTLRHVAVVVDRNGKIDGVHALHDYELWDQMSRKEIEGGPRANRPGFFGAIQNLVDWSTSFTRLYGGWPGMQDFQNHRFYRYRAWIDARGISAPRPLPNLDRASPHGVDDQRFVVVFKPREQKPIVAPVVVLSHEGNEVRVALLSEWKAFADGRTRDLNVYPVSRDQVREVPDPKAWQNLLDGKIYRAETADWATRSYLPPAHRITNTPFPAEADASGPHRYVLPVTQIGGKVFEAPVWLLRRDGEFAEVALISDWEAFRAGGKKGPLNVYRVRFSELQTAEGTTRLADLAQQYAADPKLESQMRYELQAYGKGQPTMWHSPTRSYFGRALTPFQQVTRYLAGQYQPCNWRGLGAGSRPSAQ